MASIERYEDLEVWRLARSFTVTMYRYAKEGAFAKDFGLRSQICRAAVSIVSNIAEGFECRSNSHFVNFLDMAIGSAAECRAQLYIAHDLNYIDNEAFKELHGEVVRIGQMLTRLIQYLRNQPNRPSTTIKRLNDETMER